MNLTCGNHMANEHLYSRQYFFFLGHTQDVYFSALGYETHRVWGSKLIGFTLHFYICHLGLRCIFFFISLTSTVSSGRVLRRGRPGSIVLAGVRRAAVNKVVPLALVHNFIFTPRNRMSRPHLILMFSIS